ncbi:hypothetical protein AJ80_01934 [Polytolypa hystricis UAMH7299]|uniref:Cytochrome P450 n=1 Tax=Polytolypa hystricis (strain UAMH7299) TaxID=1447883 RepID=A0A2B7YXQ2_POLH7|nr:hypothetical protein AJ80_01934 [Polytolypa hystricis UAMH7299]
MGNVIVLALVAAPALALCYVVLVSIYRLTLHPLAKFPGPKFNAISPIPGIYYLLKGRLPMVTKQDHDKYGPVIRVSPNELSFSSPKAWDDIYGHRQGHINMHKDPIHVGSVHPIPGVSTLTMSDDANHARQRRALAYSFSQKALLEQEEIVNGYVDVFIEKLGRMADRDEEFNLVNWLNFTTFDIIGDLAFGEPFGCLDQGKFHDWVSLIFETVKVGAVEQATRRFATQGSPIQNFLLSLIPKEMQKRRRDHLEQSREKVLRRLANENTSHRDFIWYIMKQKDRHDLKQDEIIVNGALFIVAGSETTANALSGMLSRLLRNPDKLHKLSAEIREHIKTEKDCTADNFRKLPYMNACIEEGLRIHPPVPAGLLRTVPKGGDFIDGYWVAEGTSVAVTSWAASHSAVNFRDPDAYIPERWLDDPEYATDVKKSMQPFSLGPRGCIGRHLSYMEMRLILGRLLWSYDLVSTDGAYKWDPEGEMKHMRAFLTWEKPELNIKLRRVIREKST